MVVLAAALVVAAYPGVAFRGKTFLASSNAAGVNGFDPAPRSVHVAKDGIRLDTGASTWAFEPWARVNSRIWRSGRIPLWNPYQGMGAPQAANLQSAVFDPLLVAVNLHPTPLVWDMSFFFAFALGAAGLYVFLRGRGLGRTASWGGTAVFVLSGYFFVYSNNHFSRTYIYLPILLHLADRVACARGWAPSVLLGAALAGCFLVGMPEATFFIVGTFGLYAGVKVISAGSTRRRLAVRFGAAIAIGAGLAAPLLLPALEYAGRSFTIHRPEDQVGLAADPVRMLLNWFLPYLYGLPAQNVFGTGFSGTRNWVGTACLVMVLGALVSRTALHRYGGGFFAVLGVVLILKCYDFPLLRWVGVLPVFVRVNFPRFALPILAFCLAVLAAIGLQAVIERDVPLRGFTIGSCVLCLGLLGLARLNWSLLTAVSGEHLRGELMCAAAFGSLAVLAVVLSVRTAASRFVAMLAVLAVVGELFALAPRDFQSDRFDMFVRPSWVRYLEQNLPPDQARVFATDAKLFPNAAGAFGLQDIRSLDALYPQRFMSFIRTFIQPEAVSRFVGGPFGQKDERQPAAILGNPMFDLTGVRYVVTAGQDPANPVVSDFFSAHQATSTVRPSFFDIAGDQRAVLFVHSGARAELKIPSGAKQLAFSFGLHPKSFDDPNADGVDAYVVPAGRAVEQALWSLSVIPGRDSPSWHHALIPIPAGLDALDLVVRPRGNPSTDWAGFADLAIDDPWADSAVRSQYRTVLSAEGAVVHENTHRIPRAFVVHDVVAVRDEAGALRWFETVGHRKGPLTPLLVDRFDPRRTAVVEGSLGVPLSGCPGEARVVVRSHRSDRVIIDSDNPCPGVLILTDTYDPGWDARINGREARIHPANVAFRAVEVPAGRATIVFTYRPQSFVVGIYMAATTGIAVLGSTAFAMARKRHRARRHVVRGKELPVVPDDPESANADRLH